MLAPAALLFIPFLALVQPADAVRVLVGRLTPEQRQHFEKAMGAFGAEQYAAAHAAFAELLNELKGEPTLSKFASEAALNTGDADYAIKVLRPLTAANPLDWQAAALLTRACAESGDATCRDDGMRRLQDLYERGVVAANVEQYILERIRSGRNTLLIRAFLKPWGPYRIHHLGQVFGPDDRMFLRIALENSESERFSIDAYEDSGFNSAGQRTQTHYTFQLLDERPSYDTVRSHFLEIAAGTAKPLSSRSGLVVR